MNSSKQTFLNIVNDRIRPSLSAIRKRGDWSPLNAWVRGQLDMPYPVGGTVEHLDATVSWLCAAQDGTPDDGVSAFYDVRMGEWCPSYPETTGYIIPTFFDYAALTGRSEIRERAIRMARWLLTLQLESGAFPIGPLWPGWKPDPIVFDTGQIIFGLVRAYEETNERAFIQAAKRAGDWLAEIMDEDGCWRRHTSLGFLHTYNVRTAWSLLWIFRATGEPSYRQTAMRNLDWALTEQDPDGWYRNAAFRPQDAPLTHTIAYTVEGFLESGLALSESKYTESARRAAEAMLKLQASDGFLRARYGSGWKSDQNWSCLTGTAQMALCWLRLYETSGDKRFYQAGLDANMYLKQRHPRNSSVTGFVGGIAGSYPIYGGYEPFRQLNWAAKFFADSLLLELRLSRSVAGISGAAG